MDVLLEGEFAPGERQRWLEALGSAMPEARWLDADTARGAPERVQAAVVANPPPGSLAAWPDLRLIQSLWAGVDRLLADPGLPAGVPLARMVDPALGAAMAETAAWAVLSLHRGFFAYARRQQQRRWHAHAQQRADEIGVLVLGQGEMGRRAALAIAALGYPVSGWARQSRLPDLPGVRALAGEAALWAALPSSAIVVNLLPLTPATSSLLDARFFGALPAGASVVNLGRGAHLVEADLLAALDAGHVRHAVLDVFRTEPLPAEHPFWCHERVTVLPHAAALTDPRSAARVAASNLRALRDGRPLAHLVDRQRGY